MILCLWCISLSFSTMFFFSILHLTLLVKMALKFSAESVYNIFENLIINVNKHAESQNYAVVKCHLKRYSKNDLIHKIILWCDWENKYVKMINDTYRKRWTTDTWLQKCFFWVNALRKNDCWMLTVFHSEHNYSSIIKFSHSALRKLNSNVQKTVVKQSAAKITFRQIVIVLWNMNSLMSLIK